LSLRARGGEGAGQELQRARGSRPNSWRNKFSIFSDLLQPQVGKNWKNWIGLRLPKVGENKEKWKKM